MSRWTIHNNFNKYNMTINEVKVVSLIDKYDFYEPIIVSERDAKEICKALNKGMVTDISLSEILDSDFVEDILEDIFTSHEELLRVNLYFNEGNGALLLDISFANYGLLIDKKLEIISEILEIDCGDIVFCGETYYFIDTKKIK